MGGLTVTLKIISKANYEEGTGTAALSIIGAVTKPGDDAIFKADLTAAQTGTLDAVPPGSKYNYVYHLYAVDGSSHVLTQKIGTMTVVSAIS